MILLCIYSFCTCNYLHAKKIQLPKNTASKFALKRITQRDTICESAVNPSHLSCSTSCTAGGHIPFGFYLGLYSCLISFMHYRLITNNLKVSRPFLLSKPYDFPPSYKVYYGMGRLKNGGHVWSTSFALLVWTDSIFHSHIILQGMQLEHCWTKMISHTNFCLKVTSKLCYFTF